MKHIFIIAFLVSMAFSVNSCGTPYRDQLKSWIGRDINNLISTLGPPSNVYTMPNGNKMYTWLYTGGSLVTSNYNYYLNMTTTNAIDYWCNLTFTANNGVPPLFWTLS